MRDDAPEPLISACISLLAEAVAVTLFIAMAIAWIAIHATGGI